MDNKAFLETFNNVFITIPFDPNWKNGTGYLDKAVQGEHMPAIPTGMTVKCVDDKGRKILITSITGQAKDGDMNGKQVSNVLFFERYASVANESPIVANASYSLRSQYSFLGNGGVSDEDFRKFHFR
jgi:hypothetical protein